MDQYTKWVEYIPLPAQTAEVTARAAVNEFFARFGFPFNIFTDKGKYLESRLFKSICDVVQIHKSRLTPYRPSENGQVERFNRTLIDAVHCFVDKSQRNWDEHLPQLASAWRLSVNRHTDFTPNKLMLGREVSVPAHLVFRPPSSNASVDLEDYVCVQITRVHSNSSWSGQRCTENASSSHEKKLRYEDSHLRICSRRYCPCAGCSYV